MKGPGRDFSGDRSADAALTKKKKRNVPRKLKATVETRGAKPRVNMTASSNINRFRLTSRFKLRRAPKRHRGFKS